MTQSENRHGQLVVNLFLRCRACLLAKKTGSHAASHFIGECPYHRALSGRDVQLLPKSDILIPK
jgi:hypothetical protein